MGSEAVCRVGRQAKAIFVRSATIPRTVWVAAIAVAVTFVFTSAHKVMAFEAIAPRTPS
jgi:hypothetical protein